ncbi:MAG: SiaB family protein kinase [Candidatus Magnetominusculus sp. LBB02]|nr:SiaB family protein kinase [Candidatus Magnetominusculus sp. LBB02]
MLTNLYDIYRQMQQEQIFFSFTGPVSQHVVEGIGAALKLKMEIEENDVNTIQKVFSIYVEQIQNIMNYSADRLNRDKEGGDIGIGIFVVGRQDGHFYVRCGNNIYNDKLFIIKEQVEELKTMGKDDLKTLFRSRRKSPPPLGSKGAGLGFIEMAIKASRPIEVDFTALDKTTSFLSITVVI